MPFQKYRSPFRGYRSLLIWLYCVLWSYPLFGENWHRKWWYVFAGAGPSVRMEIGLRKFTVTLNCGLIEKWTTADGPFFGKAEDACNRLHQLEGEYDLSELYDHVCLQEQVFLNFMRGCGPASILYWSSVLVYVCIVATLLMLTCCAFVVIYFETGEPSARWKLWAKALWFTSLATQGCAVFGYSILNLNLNELYRPVNVAGFLPLVFNSPSNMWLSSSYTAWYALSTVTVGFVLSWWTVLDLSTEEELFEDVAAFQAEQGLNAIEKELLFGTMFQGGALESQPYSAAGYPQAMQQQQQQQYGSMAQAPYGMAGRDWGDDRGGYGGDRRDWGDGYGRR
jgi:hypothetical protein